MSSPVAHYENFLLNNASTISTVQSSLRSLTWFLPGRFKDADLASEARESPTTHFISFLVINLSVFSQVSAFLNLTSLYHDSVLSRVIRSDPKFKPLIPPSQHSRFTRGWSDKNSRYKWAARTLEVIRFLELVIEMGLRRKVSNKNRWRGVFLLELVKCVIFTPTLTPYHIGRRLFIADPFYQSHSTAYDLEDNPQTRNMSSASRARF